MRVAVDASVCIGSGQCAMTVPEVFDQDEQYGTVVLLLAQPPDQLHDAVREVAERCPVRAISVDAGA